ncbi:MAG: twin-arginine translocase subunit TatC [Bacteriovoracia bacterium]
MTKNQTPFWDHLDELRSKIVLCLSLFFLGFIGFYFCSDELLNWIRKPLFNALPPDRQKLYYTSLFENFLVHLKLAGYASLTFLSPAYFLILWRFIAPGLKKKEKTFVLPYVFIGSFFFIGGGAFAYFVLLPIGIRYFLSYGTSQEVALLTLDHYVTTILKLLFGFGVCFELPVVLVILGQVGILTDETLAKNRKTAFVIITVLSALVAPPDAISMLLLMAPLYLLYEAAILIVKKTAKSNKY